jgi:hypothetical protein
LYHVAMTRIVYRSPFGDMTTRITYSDESAAWDYGEKKLEIVYTKSYGIEHTRIYPSGDIVDFESNVILQMLQLIPVKHFIIKRSEFSYIKSRFCWLVIKLR